MEAQDETAHHDDAEGELEAPQHEAQHVDQEVHSDAVSGEFRHQPGEQQIRYGNASEYEAALAGFVPKRSLICHIKGKYNEKIAKFASYDQHHFS